MAEVEPKLAWNQLLILTGLSKLIEFLILGTRLFCETCHVGLRCLNSLSELPCDKRTTMMASVGKGVRKSQCG